MTVVVGLMATPEGRAALERAADEAVVRSLPLVLVETARPAPDEESRAVLESLVAELTATVQASGLAVERRRPEGKDLAEQLVGVAEVTQASCLVIGLRRRSPVGKLILGSSAQRILLDATCPVLTVKPVR
ncbi:universal stress protein [Arsenicicoccus dermatophilus]|uniref:universal stress protein n=1 Tax=Arsenicicoccus dermatophilus TaxID=1076331 RepID=UPI001F4CDCFE|nr:universal stress protein [Arsenicicoccus dermatophilus]MCH8613249.1 universal stress protein [Arsenicicoccus dermatophilus]